MLIFSPIIMYTIYIIIVVQRFSKYLEWVFYDIIIDQMYKFYLHKAGAKWKYSSDSIWNVHFFSNFRANVDISSMNFALQKDFGVGRVVIFWLKIIRIIPPSLIIWYMKTEISIFITTARTFFFLFEQYISFQCIFVSWVNEKVVLNLKICPWGRNGHSLLNEVWNTHKY